MSDTVLLAIIAGTPGILASILGFVNQALIRRATEVGQEAAEIGAEAAGIGKKAAELGEKAAELGSKNEQHLKETKIAMAELAKNTNSIKDELVKATAAGSRAQGNLEGRAELKIELRNPDAEEQSG